MSRILIQINRNSLKSGAFDTAKRTVHTDKTKTADIHIALDFLYRFFSGVLLNA